MVVGALVVVDSVVVVALIVVVVVVVVDSKCSCSRGVVTVKKRWTTCLMMRWSSSSWQ